MLHSGALIRVGNGWFTIQTAWTFWTKANRVLQIDLFSMHSCLEKTFGLKRTWLTEDDFSRERIREASQLTRSSAGILSGTWSSTLPPLAAREQKLPLCWRRGTSEGRSWLSCNSDSWTSTWPRHFCNCTENVLLTVYLKKITPLRSRVPLFVCTVQIQPQALTSRKAGLRHFQDLLSNKSLVEKRQPIILQEVAINVWNRQPRTGRCINHAGNCPI